MSKTFGRYKVAEEIGRGAMGVVYRAVDPVIGRPVAIKAINHAYLESVGVKQDEYAARFQREAQVAGALDHVHIVKIYDLGPDYLVMEYVEGETLAARLRARGRLERAEILRIVRDAAEALDYAHERGIVHRDIKPANLMVQRDGSVKVMDFGLARIESSTLTAAGEVLGSASYMAPEVILGQAADGRADTFALAVVAYEMFTGQRPFGGASVSSIIHNVVRQQPRSASELNAALPGGYDAIFGRAFAKDPAARFPSARAFAEALEREAWPHAAVAQVGSREPAAAPALPADDPGAGTVLSVDADEVAAAPTAGEGDAGSTTVMVASPDEIAAGEDVSKATVVLNASQMESRLKELAEARQAAEAPQADRDATVRVAHPAWSATADPAATPPPPPAAGESAATMIMKAPAPPMPPAPPQVESKSEAEEAPAVQATVLMKSDQVAAVLDKVPPPPPVAPSAPPQLDALESSAATIVMKGPLASAPPPGPPESKPPAPVPPAAADEAGATIVMKPKPPAAAPPAPPVSKPAPLPVPPPPPAVKVAPAPPAATARATTPAAHAAPHGASPAPPAQRSRGGKGLVIGLALAIPIVFGLTVGGVWLWLRWQNQRAQAPAPEPTAMAEAPPSAAPAPPVATPEATAPSSEPTPEETPIPEETPVPGASAAPAAPATLLVRSQPAGASVLLGRKKRGSTPLKLTLPPGAVSVRVEKDGYKPWTSDTRVKAGETRTLEARLEPIPVTPAAAPTPTPPPAKAAVREGDLVALTDEVTPPRKTKNVSPNWPQSALRRGAPGPVMVEFVVDIDGKVSDLKVLESAGDQLDRAALDAIRQWRYAPATSHGVKVRVALRQRFAFQSR